MHSLDFFTLQCDNRMQFNIKNDNKHWHDKYLINDKNVNTDFY